MKKSVLVLITRSNFYSPLLPQGRRRWAVGNGDKVNLSHLSPEVALYIITATPLSVPTFPARGN